VFDSAPQSKATFYGIRKGKLSNCCGVSLRALLVYRFRPSLTKIMMVNAIKPVPYSIAVKKGSRKIQKAAL
jgi:hypothetical protein